MRRRATIHRAALIIALLAVALAMPPAGTAQFGKNKVRYDDFTWEIYHSTHFDVYYYQEEAHLLQMVVSYAESAYDQLSQRLDFQIQEATPLIFYEDHAAFEQTNVILNFIPEGTGAFATPVRNRMVLPVDLPGPKLMALILHELTHIFEYHMIFGANLGKGIAATPPLWFMEGLASYMAEDEAAREKMFLRDAVVNDRLPSVTDNVGGFFAYRFGHAVFDYVEEQWGIEGVRDFMIETRNTLGGRVGRSVEKAFGVPPEDFDSDFRRWLRKKYLPELVATGEPGDFGRPFRLGRDARGVQTSPTASPSGDLLAAFSTARGEVDVVLFDTRERTPLRNLTKGFDQKFDYFVAQELRLGREMGRDLAFSPDGNQVAFFARREGGRNLVLMDVLKGKIRRAIEMEVGQQLAPTWSPDGGKIAFAAHDRGRFDIFALDLDSGELTNLTDDDIFDGAPVYSPDGKSLVLSSVVGGYAKLFRIDLDSPGERFPLTHGESNETDAVFSADGKRIYFTSDRTGANNIFGLELESGEVRQHTNSLTGCFMPTVLPGPRGGERLVYTAFWKGRFDLYLLDVEEPITEPTVLDEKTEPAEAALRAEELPRFEPSIEVTIDDSNREKYGGLKFFLEDIGGGIGVSDDQTFIGAAVVRFSDFLGDRRILGAFQSVESFQNFDVFYLDLSNRLQWRVHLFDNRDFFIAFDRSTGFLERGRSAYSQTGAIGSLVYPLTRALRAELGAGYILRDIDFQSFLFDPDRNLVLDENGFPIPIIRPRKDDYPVAVAALVSDNAVRASWGHVSGRRWRLSADWAPDLDEEGTLTSNVRLDFRQYFPLTQRINFAFRAFGSASDGNFPNPIYFGGLDTVRGYDFRSIVGDHGFFTNFEFRFPLIDILATPLIGFRGIRGVIFLDIAGAWYDEVQGFRLYNSELDRLEDGLASFGWGFTVRLLGLDLNVDFAKRWNLDTTLSGYESSIWIGPRF